MKATNDLLVDPLPARLFADWPRALRHATVRRNAAAVHRFVAGDDTAASAAPRSVASERRDFLAALNRIQPVPFDFDAEPCLRLDFGVDDRHEAVLRRLMARDTLPDGWRLDRSTEQEVRRRIDGAIDVLGDLDGEITASLNLLVGLLVFGRADALAWREHLGHGRCHLAISPRALGRCGSRREPHSRAYAPGAIPRRDG